MKPATLSNEAPNVVSEEGSRELIEQGWRFIVICLQTPEKRHNHYFGEWGFKLLSPDGQTERILITARKQMEMRTIKTATGLIRFLLEFDLVGPRIPLRQGLWFVQEHGPPPES